MPNSIINHISEAPSSPITLVLTLIILSLSSHTTSSSPCLLSFKNCLNPALIRATARKCLSATATVVSSPASSASASASATAVCSALRISRPFHSSSRMSGDSKA